MRFVSLVLIGSVGSGCINKPTLTAKLKDPSSVWLTIPAYAGQPPRTIPYSDKTQRIEFKGARYTSHVWRAPGDIMVGGVRLQIGDRLGPFATQLAKLYKPGNTTFEVQGSVMFDARSYTTGTTYDQTYVWESDRIPYNVGTNIANIEYFEEPDVPDRTTGIIMLAAGAASGLGGWWMTGRDSALLKYPGYVLMVTGAINFTIGAINTLRPKRSPRITRPSGATDSTTAVETSAVPTATTPFVPPTPSGLRWIPWEGSLPNDAIAAGTTNHVCRMAHEGTLHPGKLYKGWCYIGWGGRSIGRDRNFEVLAGTAHWGTTCPTGSVAGGQESYGALKGTRLAVCRTRYQGGPMEEPGKAFGGGCNFAWGEREFTERAYEYLCVGPAGNGSPVPPAPSSPAP